MNKNNSTPSEINTNNQNIVINESKSNNPVLTTENEINQSHSHDKRYETPFEDDGAYAD